MNVTFGKKATTKDLAKISKAEVAAAKSALRKGDFIEGASPKGIAPGSAAKVLESETEEGISNSTVLAQGRENELYLVQRIRVADGAISTNPFPNGALDEFYEETNFLILNAKTAKAVVDQVPGRPLSRVQIATLKEEQSDRRETVFQVGPNTKAFALLGQELVSVTTRPNGKQVWKSHQLVDA